MNKEMQNIENIHVEEKERMSKRKKTRKKVRMSFKKL